MTWPWPTCESRSANLGSDREKGTFYFFSCSRAVRTTDGNGFLREPEHVYANVDMAAGPDFLQAEKGGRPITWVGAPNAEGDGRPDRQTGGPGCENPGYASEDEPEP